MHSPQQSNSHSHTTAHISHAGVQIHQHFNALFRCHFHVASQLAFAVTCFANQICIAFAQQLRQLAGWLAGCCTCKAQDGSLISHLSHLLLLPVRLPCTRFVAYDLRCFHQRHIRSFRLQVNSNKQFSNLICLLHSCNAFGILNLLFVM